MNTGSINNYRLYLEPGEYPDPGVEINLLLTSTQTSHNG